MTEDEILAQYSTPGLRRNELTRAAKKFNMEFDERLKGMTIAERDEFLDKYWPEPKEEPCPPSPTTNPTT